PIAGPGEDSVVGVDRGVAVSAALSTGELLHVPGLRRSEIKRLKVLQQRLARAKCGSNRRARTKLAIAKLKARETARRRDWVEKGPDGHRAAVRYDPQSAGHRRAARPAGRTKTRSESRHPPKWLGSARRAFAAQDLRSGRTGLGRVHAATMLRVRG